MGSHRSDLERTLLEKAHEQSAASPERSPFWREGPWRCEFHRKPGDERLKVFSGSRCVHEESVQNQAVAYRRAQELRRIAAQSRLAGLEDCRLR